MIKIKSKKTISIIAVVAALTVAGLLYANHKFNESSRPTDATNALGEDVINLDPATEEDKQRADQNKQAIVDREERLRNQQPSTGKNSVKPIITYAGTDQYGQQVEVGAYIPGIFEETGTCTAKFTNGESSFTKSVEAITNVSSTDCPAMAAQPSEFSKKGDWTVTVSYDSPTSSGESDSKTIKVE